MIGARRKGCWSERVKGGSDSAGLKGWLKNGTRFESVRYVGEVGYNLGLECRASFYSTTSDGEVPSIPKEYSYLRVLRAARVGEEIWKYCEIAANCGMSIDGVCAELEGAGGLLGVSSRFLCPTG